MQIPKRVLLSVGFIIVLAVGFAGGFYFKDIRGQTLPVNAPAINKDIGAPQGIDFSVFWTAWDLLHAHFVDANKLDTQKLIYGAIDGMVKAAGDPYTVFFPPVESQSFKQQINGAFSGIGIEVGMRKNIITIIAPIKDTPGYKAGLLAGDKIVKIDGKTTDGMILDDAVNLMRGAKGTKVTLTIVREGLKDTKDFVITRDTIKIPAVDWKMLDDGTTAYIQIYIFNENVDSQFKTAAQEISKSKATRIILDLRNNPGGLLNSAVDIASYFLDTDKVVTIERGGDGSENVFKTEPNGLLKNYPLIVLINKGSASASEILSGTLKDNRGVTIVGETSFGKGSVQEVDDLPNKASIKITIAKWFTPNGISINENGIKPDVPVTMTPEDIANGNDLQLNKAKELIKTVKN